MLLGVARSAIEVGLDGGEMVRVSPADYPAALREPRASFVTLRIEGKLRGCTGSIEATRPMVADVASNAYRSAFKDPRFEPLERHELASVDLHISLLSALISIACDSEQQLVALLQPGVDGVLLRDGSNSGTFLPSVWEQLPDAREFVRELKRKASLPADSWARSIKVYRYTVESIH